MGTCTVHNPFICVLKITVKVMVLLWWTQTPWNTSLYQVLGSYIEPLEEFLTFMCFLVPNRRTSCNSLLKFVILTHHFKSSKINWVLYSKYFGRTFMPPYWALGFSVSRYGYQDLEEMRQVLKRFQDNQIPLVILIVIFDFLERLI